jgi:hypothetical protein
MTKQQLKTKFFAFVLDIFKIEFKQQQDQNDVYNHLN